MNFLFLIPARGGSRRLPGKNMADLYGEPLVVRAIRVAREAAAIVRKDLGHKVTVAVSTDSQVIAFASRKAGAHVIDRPAYLSTGLPPNIGTTPAMHALSVTPEADALVLLQPTSPFRTAYDIVEACSAHVTRGLSVLATTEGEPRKANGLLYLASREVLDMHGPQNLWTPPGTEPHWLIIPPASALDIDTAEQLEQARATC